MTNNQETTFDAIIIGGGVMGSSTAYQTSKRGLNTLLLEQFDFLHHRGSSHGESRTTRVTYPETYYPEMVIQSTALFQQAESEVGYRVYFNTPQLDMGPQDSKSLNSVIKSCRDNSIPVRILNPTEVYEEFNGIFKLPADWIGVVTEHGGVLKPTKAVSMFQALALKNGAVLRDGSEVVDIIRDAATNDIVVSTKRRESFRARKCVITAGAWTKNLIERVRGLTLPIQPLETTVHYWRIKRGQESKFTMESNFPTFASYGDTYVYGTPSFEYPGLIKIPLHSGRACEPQERTWAASERGVQALREWVREIFNGLVDWEGGPVISQSCLYSMTPDEDFVVDFLGGEFGEDVVVCGGFSGHGFKMAPLIGKVAAEMVAGDVVRDVDLTHFRVGRFNGGYGRNLKGSNQVRSH